jgi:hypothetical protein
MLARMSLSTPGLFATIPNSVTAANRPRPLHRLRLTSGKLAGVLWLLDRRHSDHRSRHRCSEQVKRCRLREYGACTGDDTHKSECRDRGRWPL